VRTGERAQDLTIQEQYCVLLAIGRAHITPKQSQRTSPQCQDAPSGHRLMAERHGSVHQLAIRSLKLFHYV